MSKDTLLIEIQVEAGDHVSLMAEYCCSTMGSDTMVLVGLNKGDVVPTGKVPEEFVPVTVMVTTPEGLADSQNETPPRTCGAGKTMFIHPLYVSEFQLDTALVQVGAFIRGRRLGRAPPLIVMAVPGGA